MKGIKEAYPRTKNPIDYLLGEAEKSGLKTEQDVVDLVKIFGKSFGRGIMRIMTDMNILISAIHFSNSIAKRVLEKILLEH